MRVYRTTTILDISEDPLQDLIFDLECTADVQILALHWQYRQHKNWLVTNSNELERKSLWLIAMAKWSRNGVQIRREALNRLNSFTMDLKYPENISSAFISLFRETEDTTQGNASVAEEDDDLDIDTDYFESEDEAEDERDIPQRISDLSATQLFTPRRTIARTMRKSTRRL